MAESERKERDKIFDGDKKPINVSGDLVRLIDEDAKTERLFQSQILDRIVRGYYSEKGRA